ncbi:hypothetical protein N0V84_005945 [Fusarium piperis]|uniref:Glycosyl hydrolase family 32 C-terminal domain-containing protein n=1 Tax=Fusarium piperis TaxID=1435070 RepID=A0A9W8WD17_9HYPO|nr:hypothetical protein N0V84_005945 [Fusarium piperis]
MGTKQGGEKAVGELKSTSVRASSVMSFLVSGGYDVEKLYVGLVRDSDNTLLLKQTGANDETLIRVIWDTGKWAGQKVNIIMLESSTSGAWGRINVDDIRVGCDVMGDGRGLTFNIFGQANQPAAHSSPSCSLMAADPMRPQFHYTQYQGWINDPAGLSQWNAAIISSASSTLTPPSGVPLTRELFICNDGGLGSRPIEAPNKPAAGPAKKLRRRSVGETPLVVGSSDTARLQVVVDLDATKAQSFAISLFKSKAESVLLTYTTTDRTLTLDTTDAEYGQAGTWKVAIDIPRKNKLTLEIFADDGTVMTANVWPRYQEPKDITIVGRGGNAVFDSV